MIEHLIGIVLALVTLVILNGGNGGGISSIGVSKSRRNEIDRKIEGKFKNGTGSSKQELQEWWDTYHK